MYCRLNNDTFNDAYKDFKLFKLLLLFSFISLKLLASDVEVSAPLIHYTWVGEPTALAPAGQIMLGLDVAGPIATAKKIQQQIKEDPNNSLNYSVHYWCLDKYIRYYENIFTKNEVKIFVHSIEETLKSFPDNSHVKKLYKLFLSDKRELRDILRMNIGRLSDENIKDNTLNVFLKDGFTMFLLAHNHGYIFDTNVFPLASDEKREKIDLITNYPKIALCLSGESKWDFFAMYSPKPKLSQALQMFESWTSSPKWGYLELFTEEHSSENIGPWNIGFLNYNDLGFEKISFKTYEAPMINLMNMMSSHDFLEFISPPEFTNLQRYFSVLKM